MQHQLSLLIPACLLLLPACQTTPQQMQTDRPGPRALVDEDTLRQSLLESEFRNLLEVQDSYRMMLNMSSSTTLGDRKLVWTDAQKKLGDQLSTDIVGLLSRYTLEITIRANDPVPMDPILFGREVGKLADRRAALWLSLAKSNNLPESARSIFHHGMIPPR